MFLLCVVFASRALWAQNVQISGVVTDDADGNGQEQDEPTTLNR
jgi:hypothetical protein